MPTRPNVLFITLDQWRADCLSRRRPPGRRDAQPRPAGRRGRPVRQPLRPVHAVRSEPGVDPHRAVPEEPPLGSQRHAARRPLHQPGARGPLRRLRPDALRLHRHQPRPAAAPPRRPAAAAPTRGCCPGSPRGSTIPEPFEPWLDWLRDKGYEIPPGPGGRVRPRSAGRQHRAGLDLGADDLHAAEHSITAFVTDHVLDHLRGRRGLVRARQLPAAPPAVPGHPRAPRPLRPRRRAPTRPARRAARPRRPATPSWRRPWPCASCSRPTTSSSSGSGRPPTTP